jgi:hypothetical protein
MAWQLLAAALPYAAKTAGTLLQKPREEEFKPQTDYMKKYLSYLRGRTADREVMHMAMQPQLRAIGGQGREMQRQVGYDVERSGLTGSGIEAQMRLSAGQKTQEALATATEKAVSTQTAESARLGEKAADLGSRIEAEESRAEQAYDTATSQWKRQVAGDVINLGAAVGGAAIQQGVQVKESKLLATRSGLFGDEANVQRMIDEGWTPQMFQQETARMNQRITAILGNENITDIDAAYKEFVGQHTASAPSVDTAPAGDPDQTFTDQQNERKEVSGVEPVGKKKIIGDFKGPDFMKGKSVKEYYSSLFDKKKAGVKADPSEPTTYSISNDPLNIGVQPSAIEIGGEERFPDRSDLYQSNLLGFGDFKKEYGGVKKYRAYKKYWKQLHPEGYTPPEIDPEMIDPNVSKDKVSKGGVLKRLWDRKKGQKVDTPDEVILDEHLSKDDWLKNNPNVITWSRRQKGKGDAYIQRRYDQYLKGDPNKVVRESKQASEKDTEAAVKKAREAATEERARTLFDELDESTSGKDSKDSMESIMSDALDKEVKETKDVEPVKTEAKEVKEVEPVKTTKTDVKPVAPKKETKVTEPVKPEAGKTYSLYREATGEREDVTVETDDKGRVKIKDGKIVVRNKKGKLQLIAVSDWELGEPEFVSTQLAAVSK